MTIVGPSGLGKTTLVQYVLNTHFTTFFEDGMWYVDLAAVVRPEEVAVALATVLLPTYREPQADSEPIIEQIHRRVRNRDLLIVFNNAENVTDGCSEIIEKLTQSHRKIKFLTTSQKDINLFGRNHTFGLVPLKHVQLDQNGSTRLTVDELMLSIKKNPAFSLFEQIRNNSQSTFRIDRENIVDVARIIAFLGGIPLFIILAASRTGYDLGLMLTALEQDVSEVLSTDSSALEPYQRNVADLMKYVARAVLNNETEKSVFIAASVVVGTFTRQCIEHLASTSVQTAGEIRSAIQSLISGSLIVPDGSMHLRILDVPRQWALKQIGGGERRHALESQLQAWCINLTTRYRTAVGGDKIAQMPVIDANYDAIRSAIAIGLDSATLYEDRQVEAQVEAALILCADMWNYWKVRGRWVEGMRWLNRLLATPQVRQWESNVMDMSSALTTLDVRRASRIADARNGAGLISTQEGDFEPALLHLLTSVRIAIRIGNIKQEADTKGTLGYLVWWAGKTREIDYSARIPFPFDGPHLLNLYDSVRAEGGLLGNAAELATFWPLYGNAREDPMAIPQLLRLAEKYGDIELQSLSHRLFAEVALQRGDMAEAEREVRIALQLSQSISDWGSMATNLFTLAKVARKAGDLENAARLCLYEQATRRAMDRMPPNAHELRSDEMSDAFGTFKAIVADLGDARTAGVRTSLGNVTRSILLSLVPIQLQL